ncbi:hypothetical protein E2562_006280 [Oryza meyeriana var. granulata]|uniref:Uncharacterized protein n=1 Tax=Oryza meyeriana var. granulata TaxID=110450 RepID=A0A6G1EHD7_9ORYZ|nr:hypothetical protein E2562_006280 [Oryza meyeriana var. granulata]
MGGVQLVGTRGLARGGAEGIRLSGGHGLAILEAAAERAPRGLLARTLTTVKGTVEKTSTAANSCHDA